VQVEGYIPTHRNVKLSRWVSTRAVGLWNGTADSFASLRNGNTKANTGSLRFAATAASVEMTWFDILSDAWRRLFCGELENFSGAVERRGEGRKLRLRK